MPSIISHCLASYKTQQEKKITRTRHPSSEEEQSHDFIFLD